VLAGIWFTVAVLFEFALTTPTALVAVTTQRTVLPASSLTNTYVLAVAPPMFNPARCH
jgi:hypothetical protein